MATGELQVKKQTVLELSLKINEGLYQLRNMLDNKFNNLPKDSQAEEVKPNYPNILDEIIENQTLGIEMLEQITHIVDYDVIRKVG